MLPVATPPNALVMAPGIIQPSDMARTGLFLNLFCAAILSMWTFVAGGLFDIHLGVVPNWANATV